MGATVELNGHSGGEWTMIGPCSRSRLHDGGDFAILDEKRQIIGETFRKVARDTYVEADMNGLLFLNAREAPHDCDVSGCPGPENKRKLEVFDELVTALEGLLPMWESGIKEPHVEQARAALARAEKKGVQDDPRSD